MISIRPLVRRIKSFFTSSSLNSPIGVNFPYTLISNVEASLNPASTVPIISFKASKAFSLEADATIKAIGC